MAKWIPWLGILSVCFSCQPEIPTSNQEGSDKIESGTIEGPEKDSAIVPLIFLLEELEVKGLKQFTIRDTALYKKSSPWRIRSKRGYYFIWKKSYGMD